MSHTEYHGATKFSFNGGYDGEVGITNMENEMTIEIPMSDLLGFIAGYVRQRKIEKLEGSITDDEVFGL